MVTLYIISGITVGTAYGTADDQIHVFSNCLELSDFISTVILWLEDSRLVLPNPVMDMSMGNTILYGTKLQIIGGT